MKLALCPVLITLAAVPAGAEPTGYDQNKNVLLFTEAPCTAVLEAIDLEMPEFPSNTEVFFYGTKPHFQRMGQTAAIVGVSWGFLLGYDAARGGLNTDKQTTLEILRDECGKTPQETAISILDRMAENKPR